MNRRRIVTDHSTLRIRTALGAGFVVGLRLAAQVVAEIAAFPRSPLTSDFWLLTSATPDKEKPPADRPGAV
jgi:hypothetical protein